MTIQVKVRCGGKNTIIPADSGESLLSILRREGYVISAPCGGNGKCGKCLVTLRDQAGEYRVPACRTVAANGMEVQVEEIAGGEILSGGESAVQAGEGESGLGAAIDLGTTTVALELFDLRDGSRRGSAAAWNVQAPFGADVISRSQFCMEHPDGVATLQRAVRAQTAKLLAGLGAEPGEVKRIFVTGNTIMQHLYAGLDPSSIARAPFKPVSLFDGSEPQEPGLAYAPCVAGYVGGDITAGLYASGLAEREEHSLYLDLGTNGEMALGGRKGFLCCAVASGPAFEGGGISCGMPGINGAVSHVRWEEGALRLEVIGGGEPEGLCGSGLIDLLAILCRRRCISATGRLLPPEEAPGELLAHLGEDENGNGIFYLTDDRRIFLNSADVRMLQLAKAAVAAGIRVLLRKSGTELSRVDRLYLAGGFGNYMDVHNAAEIGMLPAELAERTILLGNASLAGARLALLDPAAKEGLLAIQRSSRYIELSGDAAFNEDYPEQMLFYEEDEEEWN